MNKKEELEKLGYKTYENDEIIVFWNPKVCIHSGKCVEANDEVFEPSRRPWIDLSKLEAIKIAKIIDNCPSKALQYELKINIAFNINESRSIASNGKTIIGECDFINRDNKWVITHTGVNDDYNGRGIAKMLVEKVAFEAINNNVKILPLCSYAQKLLYSKEEYKNLLAKD